MTYERAYKMHHFVVGFGNGDINELIACLEAIRDLFKSPGWYTRITTNYEKNREITVGIGDEDEFEHTSNILALTGYDVKRGYNDKDNRSSG